MSSYLNLAAGWRRAMRYLGPPTAMLVAVACVTTVGAAQTPAPAPSDSAAKPAVPLQTIPAGQLFGVFGRHVNDADGNDIGRLWDILVDRDDKPRGVVIDYGGMLGVVERKVAVAWQAVKLVPGDPSIPINLTLTKRQLGEIPAFNYDGGPIVLGGGN